MQTKCPVVQVQANFTTAEINNSRSKITLCNFKY